MASRTLQVSEKDIRQESRIVWPSFDDWKGTNYSKGNKLFLKVSGLAGAVMTRLQRKSKGQRKKTQNDSAGLFTADLSALTRKEWGDALAQSWRCGIFADCGGGHRKSIIKNKVCVTMLTQRRIFTVINYLCKKPRTSLKLITLHVR